MKRAIILALGFSAILWAVSARADTAKIVMIAGHPSHGPGDHEHNAGILLLAKCLQQCVPGVEPVIVKNGWPSDEKVFEGARSVVFFMDGGGGHPAIQGEHLTTLKNLAAKGVGLVFIHYSVEVPKGKAGDAFQDLIGGYYETGFSTNPTWDADFKAIAQHPITRGVKPFKIADEWYFNIRFRPEMKGVKALLVATPPDQVRAGGPAAVRETNGREEVVSWCVERPDGGRGFGFTGGHFHKNWGDPNFRTLVLNAILWTAKVDVPEGGVPCEVSKEDLSRNLDPK